MHGQGHLEVRLNFHLAFLLFSSAALPHTGMTDLVYPMLLQHYHPGLYLTRSGETGKETGYGSGCSKVSPCLIREGRKWTHLVNFWLWSEARWAKVPEGYEEVTLDKCQCLQDSAHNLFTLQRCISCSVSFSFPVSIAEHIWCNGKLLFYEWNPITVIHSENPHITSRG